MNSRYQTAPIADYRPRASGRSKLNFEKDAKALLFAFGDDKDPLPGTVRVLDEIMTDYILEVCHKAAAYASYGRRTKLKVDDFKFAVRKDPIKLGRIQELMNAAATLAKARKVFDPKDDSFGAAQQILMEETEAKPKDGKSSKGRRSGLAGNKVGKRIGRPPKSAM